MVEVVTVDERNEAAFLNYVSRDPVEHYFFILDWKLNKDETEIYMALERDTIEGLMLVYKGRIVVLRGNPQTAPHLLDRLEIDTMQLTVPLGFKEAVVERYRPENEYPILMMSLNRGSERLQKKHGLVELTLEDAEEVATIMRESYPPFWSYATAEKVGRSLDQILWLGVKDEGRILSLGNTQIADFGSNIGVIVTREEHRGRGLATSVVSGLVERIMQECDLALIHVIESNARAIHVYEKIGFSRCRKYVLLHIG